MRVIVPIKTLSAGKSRLAPVLDAAERAHFSALLLQDVLKTLSQSACVSDIVVVSSDPGLATLLRDYHAELMLLESDSGYSRDVLTAVHRLNGNEPEPIAIIPSDVPQVLPAEVEMLSRNSANGMTLCPARRDGGTNALVFTPPLMIPLLFGKDSFDRHRQAAAGHGLDVRVLDLPGLAHDIDTPGDLAWLGAQSSGGMAWSWVRNEGRIAC